MSNFLGNITLAFKLKLGSIPSTQAYEAKLQKGWEDVEFFRQFPKKDIWREYERLKSQKLFSKKERKTAKLRIKEIESSSDYRRYKKLSKSSYNAELLKFEPTFVENFDKNQIDQNKWLPKYYWGDKLLGKGYSHTEELHHYTEGQNLLIKNGMLSIRTSEGKNTAVAWDKKFGFIPRKCEYTSGVINTGHSFRQKHGRFEAKVTFNRTDGVYNAFWMVGENAAPHLNVFKLNDKLELGLINDIKKNDHSSVSSELLKENTYVVGIEWTGKEIKWLINGVSVKHLRNNLPNEALYLVFSSGVHKRPSGNVVNDFIIDWVRCYKKN